MCAGGVYQHAPFNQGRVIALFPIRPRGPVGQRHTWKSSQFDRLWKGPGEAWPLGWMVVVGKRLSYRRLDWQNEGPPPPLPAVFDGRLTLTSRSQPAGRVAIGGGPRACRRGQVLDPPADLLGGLHGDLAQPDLPALAVVGNELDGTTPVSARGNAVHRRCSF